MILASFHNNIRILVSFARMDESIMCSFFRLNQSSNIFFCQFQTSLLQSNNETIFPTLWDK
jgi:hypothetical protein